MHCAANKVWVQLARCECNYQDVEYFWALSGSYSIQVPIVFFYAIFCFQDNYFDLRKLLEKSKQIFANQKAVQLAG